MPTMRALYSLLSRARTVCALSQAAATCAYGGWTALSPVQLLVLGCGLCILIRMLAPSPSTSGRKCVVLADHLCSLIAAGAVIGLAAIDAADSWGFIAGLVLGG
jgi:hypothetical protein